MCVSREVFKFLWVSIVSLPMASIATVKAGNMTTLERLEMQQERQGQWQKSYQEQEGQWQQHANAAAHGQQHWYGQQHWSSSSWTAAQWQQMDSGSSGSIGSHSSFTTKSKINKDVSLGNLKNEWPKSLKT